MTDPFKINNLKMIEVEVTEINPYYLKLEDMETNVTDNNSFTNQTYRSIKRI